MQSFHFCVNLICAKDIFSSFWSQIVTIQLAYKASDVKADILPAVSGSLEIPITFNFQLESEYDPWIGLRLLVREIVWI